MILTKIPKIWLIIPLLWLSIKISFAEKYISVQDSLAKNLAKASSKPDKVKYANALANYFANVNLDSSLFYLDVARSNFTEATPKDLIYNNQISRFYYFAGNFKQDSVQKYLELMKSEFPNFGPIEKARFYGNVGTWHMRMGRSGTAATFFEKALSVKDGLNPEKIRALHLNISNLLSNIKDFKGSLEHGRIALSLAKSLGNDTGRVALALINIASAQEQLHNLDSSEILLLKVIEMTKPPKFAAIYNKANYNLGHLNKTKGRYKQALGLMRPSIKYQEENGDLYFLGNGYNAMAELFIYTSQWDSALVYAYKAINNVKNGFGTREDEMLGSIFVAEALQKGKNSESVNLLLKAIALKDSIYMNEANSVQEAERKLEQLNSKMELEKETAANKILEAEANAKQNLIIGLSVAALSIIAALGILLFLMEKNRKQQKALLLATQLEKENAAALALAEQLNKDEIKRRLELEKELSEQKRMSFEETLNRLAKEGFEKETLLRDLATRQKNNEPVTGLVGQIMSKLENENFAKIKQDFIAQNPHFLPRLFERKKLGEVETDLAILLTLERDNTTIAKFLGWFENDRPKPRTTIERKNKLKAKLDFEDQDEMEKWLKSLLNQTA